MEQVHSFSAKKKTKGKVGVIINSRKLLQDLSKTNINFAFDDILFQVGTEHYVKSIPVAIFTRHILFPFFYLFAS